MAFPDLPILFREIDDANREDHTYFQAHDQWFFLWEKTSGRDYTFSEPNDLISNLKKAVNSSDGQLYWKGRAISHCAAALRYAIKDEWLNFGTLVPVPPSKSPTDPLYDNRMERVCNLIRPGNTDVRNLVVQNQSMVASHERAPGQRITIEELLDAYSIDETISDPAPTHIAIVDDMLTAGTHYRAMHQVLSQRFPEAFLFGVFVARRIFSDDPIDL